MHDAVFIYLCEFRERLRQLATARLAEQGRRVMQEANFLFQQQEAAAAMQRNVRIPDYITDGPNFIKPVRTQIC